MVEPDIISSETSSITTAAPSFSNTLSASGVAEGFVGDKTEGGSQSANQEGTLHSLPSTAKGAEGR